MSEVRRCGNTWMVCDGNCNNCAFDSTTSTAASIIIRYEGAVENIEDHHGENG